MEVNLWIKAVAALGLEPEDAEETQITNAALSEHDYRIGLAKVIPCEHDLSLEPLWHWPPALHWQLVSHISATSHLAWLLRFRHQH